MIQTINVGGDVNYSEIQTEIKINNRYWIKINFSGNWRESLGGVGIENYKDDLNLRFRKNCIASDQISGCWVSLIIRKMCVSQSKIDYDEVENA